MEKERDFYFTKLRKIELLCQEQEQGQENNDLMQRLVEALYRLRWARGSPRRAWSRGTRPRTAAPAAWRLLTHLGTLDTSIFCENFSSGELEHMRRQAQQKPVVPSPPVTSMHCPTHMPATALGPISFAKTEQSAIWRQTWERSWGHTPSTSPHSCVRWVLLSSFLSTTTLPPCDHYQHSLFILV